MSLFQSPKSGQICLNDSALLRKLWSISFQSPKSGQICLNEEALAWLKEHEKGFNPLNRVKFV